MKEDDAGHLLQIVATPLTLLLQQRCRCPTASSPGPVVATDSGSALSASRRRIKTLKPWSMAVRVICVVWQGLGTMRRQSLESGLQLKSHRISTGQTVRASCEHAKKLDTSWCVAIVCLAHTHAKHGNHGNHGSKADFQWPSKVAEVAGWELGGHQKASPRILHSIEVCLWIQNPQLLQFDTFEIWNNWGVS